MALCPRCRKADIPLLSKKCPLCGYIVDGEKAEEMVGTLERLLLDIKNLPKPTFIDSIREVLYIVVPVLTLYFVVLALISDAGFFWILGGAGGAASLWSAVRKIWTHFKPSANRFQQLKNEYEYHAGVARRSFGKDGEVARLINDLSAEIAGVEAEHAAARRRCLYMWLAAGTILFALAATGVITTKSAADDGKAPSERPAEGWQAKVDAFRASPDNNEYGDNAARLAVLEEILRNGEMGAAEDFFFECCQGNVGDLECARAIVRAYMADGQTAEAMGFVNRVALRYASDAGKLKKMLQKYGTIQ